MDELISSGWTPRPGELEWDPNADTTSFNAMGRAFREALGKPGYFPSMVQWTAVWNRYAPAAVAMGQLTWPQALAHRDQMYKLAEEERYCGNSPAVVFVYDELLRKSVANRAEWHDKSLDLAVVFGERDKQILEAARTRILQTSKGRNSSGSNPPLVSANDRANEAAEAERIVSRASQAAKELAKQQAQLEASMKAMSAAEGKGKEENKGKTNKQLKTEKFFDKQRTQATNKKWTSGASANQSWWGLEVARDDADVTGSNLPDCLQDLPRCDEVLKTTGELFGCLAAVTLALTFEKVPCMCPWDSAFGTEFEVSEILVRLATESRLSFVHCGLPCQ